MSELESARYAVQWLTDALDYAVSKHPELREDPAVLEYMRRATTPEPHPRCAENDARST